MVDVFDEVEEELRQERYRALLNKYGPAAGAIAAAIVIGVAGYQFWTWQTKAQSHAASDQYMAASSLVEGGQWVEAELAFGELADNGPRGYASLSLLRQGDLALARGDREDAIGFYLQAASRTGDDLVRDLATYKAALLQFEDLSFDDLAVRLSPLMDGDGAYGLLARELVAAAALRDERWDEARSRYELLAIALDLPPGLAQRAGEAIAYINQNAPAETAADTTDDAVILEPEAATESEEDSQ